MPFLLPNQQCQSTEGKTLSTTTQINAGGYAHIKYVKGTGYHDSSYVPQGTNM